MKRDDETFLEYLKRLAKEAAAGYGELADQRLTRARPDVAERRGLLEPQYDETMVMEEQIPQPPIQPETPTSDRGALLNSLELLDRPRSALTSMLTQTGDTSPITSRMPDIGQMDTVGEMDQGQPTSDFMMEGLIRRNLPREPGQLPNQLLEERVTTEQQGGDAYLPGMGLGVTRFMEGMKPTSGDLEARLTAAETEDDPYAGVNPNLTEMVTGITEEREVLEGDKTPGTDTKLDFKRKPISSAARWITRDTPLGDFFFGEGEAEDSKESAHDWGAIDKSLKGDGVEAPSKEKAIKTAESESKKTDSGKPSFDGYGSKAEFFKAMGLSTEGNKYLERMDKIDSEAGMFDMIAMLGGAGNSRAGANFRNKSYQRLRTEMQMDQRDWDRAYKIFSHPWDTWFDEKGIRDPIARLRGTGPPPGEGWAKTRPPKEVRPTGPTQFLEEIKSSYDGSENSLDLIVMRLAMEDTASWGMDREGALEGAALYAKKLLKLPFTPWTDTEKSQARAMMAKDDVQSLMRMINSKSDNLAKPHIPADLKVEVEAFLTPEMRAKYDPNEDPSSSRMGLSRRFKND